MAFAANFLDELKARVDLADLISKRVKLTRKGREHQGLCPFHNEKTPSFTVSTEKGFYHCFGCGAHGNAVGFLMEYDRLGFVDAIEELARMAGVEIPHGWNNCDTITIVAPFVELLSQFHFRMNYLHGMNIRRNNAQVRDSLCS